MKKERNTGRVKKGTYRVEEVRREQKATGAKRKKNEGEKEE